MENYDVLDTKEMYFYMLYDFTCMHDIEKLQTTTCTLHSFITDESSQNIIESVRLISFKFILHSIFGKRLIYSALCVHRWFPIFPSFSFAECLDFNMVVWFYVIGNGSNDSLYAESCLPLAKVQLLSSPKLL